MKTPGDVWAPVIVACACGVPLNGCAHEFSHYAAGNCRIGSADYLAYLPKYFRLFLKGAKVAHE